MTRYATGLATVCLLGAIWPVGSPGAEPAPTPELDRLKAHVFALASPDLEGRRGAGGRKAADYVTARFRALGLTPLFDGDFFQTIPGQGDGPPLGRNVGAFLPGSDPALKDEWLIVSAHYDHLGRRGDRLYPGADDNASGVAMMLEVARTLVEGKPRPRRGVMFLAFDLEEVGLYGSRYFVEHPPVPLDSIRLFLTADMIGRSLGGVCDPYVFVMGTEHSPGVRPWLTDAARAHDPGLKLGVLGSDLLVLPRSDYGPFRARQVPFLFFSTGESPVYHTPDDTPETLDYPKLTAVSRVIATVVKEAGSADRVPRWSKAPDNPVAEAEAIRDVIRALLANRDRLRIGAAQALIMGNALRTLDGIVARGSITPEERGAMVQVARIILATVF